METPREQGFRKAAQLLLLLGKNEAAQVLGHLSEKEIEGITREIASIEKLETREAERVLEEFGYRARGREVRGGAERARQILTTALGRTVAEPILERVLSRSSPPFSFLEDLDLEQVKLLLKEESVPVISIILVHLSPERAARVLTSLPAEQQKALVRRIAELRQLDPEVIRRAEETLREKVRAQGRVVSREIDGRSALADILKHMGHSAEKDILGRLKDQDASLAREVEKKIYSPAAILGIPDRELQEVLKEFSETEVAMLLKGLDTLQKEKILSNVSTNRREMIQGEYEALGAVRRSEVEKIRREFLGIIRLQEEKGGLTVSRRDEPLKM